MSLKWFMLLINYRVSFKSSHRRCSIETLTNVFSCNFCKIFQNTFFTEHLWTTTFVAYVSNANKNSNAASSLLYIQCAVAEMTWKQWEMFNHEIVPPAYRLSWTSNRKVIAMLLKYFSSGWSIKMIHESLFYLTLSLKIQRSLI